MTPLLLTLALIVAPLEGAPKCRVEQRVIAWSEDGAAALQAGRSTPPDVILLDLMMPVLDGLGFLDARMDIPGLRDVPVVVLTAMEMGDDEERELRARLAGLVRKGDLGRRELLRLIDRAVDEAERGDAEPEPGLDHRDA